jgi:hypothetical protein
LQGARPTRANDARRVFGGPLALLPLECGHLPLERLHLWVRLTQPLTTRLAQALAELDHAGVLDASAGGVRSPARPPRARRLLERRRELTHARTRSFHLGRCQGGLGAQLRRLRDDLRLLHVHFADAVLGAERVVCGARVVQLDGRGADALGHAGLLCAQRGLTQLGVVLEEQLHRAVGEVGRLFRSLTISVEADLPRALVRRHLQDGAHGVHMDVLEPGALAHLEHEAVRERHRSERGQVLLRLEEALPGEALVTHHGRREVGPTDPELGHEHADDQAHQRGAHHPGLGPPHHAHDATHIER